MGTLYPGVLDPPASRPTPGIDKEDGSNTSGGSDPSKKLSTLLNDLDDKVQALQSKLGVNGSNVGTSIEYRINRKADIVSGLVPLSELGTGTPSTTTFLRGDQAWGVLPDQSLEQETVYTASMTLALADAGRVVGMNVASANTVTVPTNAAVPFPIGTVIELFERGAGQTSIVAASGVTLLASGGRLKLANQYAVAGLRKSGTNEWVVSGDLTT